MRPGLFTRLTCAISLLACPASRLAAHTHETEKVKNLLAVTSGITGFEENKGQFTDQEDKPVPFVLFKAGAQGVDFYITENGLTLVLLQKEHKAENGKHADTPVEYARIDMKLPGAQIRKENILAELPSKDFTNYYYAHAPQGIKEVRKYGRITVHNIYPGIDWVWHADAAQGMKYDFVVHPGADPAQIKMEYQWADIIPQEGNSSIRLHTPLGDLLEGGLRTFCGEKEIPSAYTVKGKSVSFRIAGYDRSKDLVIDPPLTLMWGTYFGGNS
ncbi:MAG: hypothetical protein FD123_3783 [Bacteroidetes bacterium]|nr:MAG: hypothetical protein FD123_3783 [Bacteroidota bacterium]